MAEETDDQGTEKIEQSGGGAAVGGNVGGDVVMGDKVTTGKSTNRDR
jgi:hypothetical protein